MKNLFLFYDIYERHRKVGEQISSADEVLDVGGQLDQLSKFSHPKKIIVANVANSQEKSDVVIKGDKLPFKNNSFSVVCSIDVLEHIPSINRQKFVNELLRVASQKVILSFPYGTKNHVNYEKEIADWLKKKGHDIEYLEEHIKYGLPNREEVQKLTSGVNSRVLFSGNINVNKLLFKIFLFDPKIKFVRKLTYTLKLLFNFISNPILYAMLSNSKYSQSVNRAYIIINK